MSRWMTNVCLVFGTVQVLLPVASGNTCLLSCNPGDALSGSSCFDDYPATADIDCPATWTRSGNKCTKDLCSGANSGIGTYYIGAPLSNSDCDLFSEPSGCRCYSGSRNPPTFESGYYTCAYDPAPPPVYYTMFTNGNRWCYANEGAPMNACNNNGGVFITQSGTCQKGGTSVMTCPIGGSLRPDGVTCRITYAAVDLVGETRCGSSYAPSSAGCIWCPGITVCLPTGVTCYANCYAATANQATCTRLGSSCQWCGTSGSIGVCQPPSVACFSTCLAATVNPSACDASSECKWCDTSSSIGVCQLEAGTCYATCLDASITAEAAVCSGSLLCEWCSGPAYLPYCRRNDEACLSRCVDVAPYNPGICQVPSVGGTCQWCGGLEYCVNADDAATLRCASRCETMIWRHDVCDGALACHWCPQHGGRCKPVKGRTQGYVGWRGESECDTGSASVSFTPVASHTATRTCSASLTSQSTHSATPTTTAASVTNDVTLTVSLLVLPSLTSAATHSGSWSTSVSRVSSSRSLSRSISRSDTFTVSSDDASQSESMRLSLTPSKTHPLPRTTSHTPTDNSTVTPTHTLPLVRRPKQRVPQSVVDVLTATAFGVALVGSVAGVGGPAGVSRMKALLALTDCVYDHVAPLDVVTSPTGFAFGAPHGAHYRGGVAGTLLVLLSWCVVAAACGLVFAKLRPSVVPVLLRLRAPSVFVLGFAVVVEGLCVVSVAAVVHAQVGLDYVAGVVGCVVVLLVLCASCLALQRFTCTLQPIDVLRGGNLVALLGASCEWQPWSASAALHLRRNWYLVDGSRVAWYVTVQLGITAACGVVEGLRLDGGTACWVTSIMMLVLATALGAFILHQRPSVVLLDSIFLSLTTAVFFVGSALLVACRLYSDTDSVAIAAQIAALCGLLIGILQLLCGIVVWVLQRFVALRGVAIVAEEEELSTIIRTGGGEISLANADRMPQQSVNEEVLMWDLELALEKLGTAKALEADESNSVLCAFDKEYLSCGAGEEEKCADPASRERTEDSDAETSDSWWPEEEFMFSELLQLQQMRDGRCGKEFDELQHAELKHRSDY